MAAPYLCRWVTAGTPQRGGACLPQCRAPPLPSPPRRGAAHGGARRHAPPLAKMAGMPEAALSEMQKGSALLYFGAGREPTYKHVQLSADL